MPAIADVITKPKLSNGTNWKGAKDKKREKHTALLSARNGFVAGLLH